MIRLLPVILVRIALLLPLAAAPAQSKPLKVFILAGQSNMQGHAEVRTFDYLGDDPATAPMLAEMRGPDGTPRVLERVWISSVGCLGDAYTDLTEKHGRLTAGYGAPEDKIGPEFTFGITMEKLLDEPILIIKTAWGGRSLHTDFRPPSAGPYQLSAWQLENYPKQEGHGIPKDFEQWKAEKIADTGVYYREMIRHVKHVLADPKRVCPVYDEAAGCELAGFVWLQGFNDMVDHHVYPEVPEGSPTNRFAQYSELLGHLIRDVRKDLGAPDMPFVIGVMGVDGLKAEEGNLAFREAMAAPASLPGFAGNVIAVQTAPFWSEELAAIDRKRREVSDLAHFLRSKHRNYANKDGTMTEAEQRAVVAAFEAEHITPEEAALWERGASNGGYHYLGCAKTFALMGQAFAEALVEAGGRN
jgi:alpha-galactosidase